MIIIVHYFFVVVVENHSFKSYESKLFIVDNTKIFFIKELRIHLMKMAKKLKRLSFGIGSQEMSLSLR